jgi:hypothetical protein
MRRVSIPAVATGVLLLTGLAVALRSARFSSADRSAQLIHGGDTAAPLEFRDLLDSGPKLQPSAKATALDGKRVRVVGFMAEMEEPIPGAFYLVPRPIRLDESGAGTGDLPLESILIAVPGSEGKIIPHAEGALEGIGLLEVGNRADDQGRVSNFRLRLDPDQRLAQAHAAAATSSKN